CVGVVWSMGPPAAVSREPEAGSRGLVSFDRTDCLHGEGGQLLARPRSRGIRSDPSEAGRGDHSAAPARPVHSAHDSAQRISRTAVDRTDSRHGANLQKHGYRVASVGFLADRHHQLPHGLAIRDALNGFGAALERKTLRDTRPYFAGLIKIEELCDH